MSGLLPVPEACQLALAAIEADPLTLPAEIQAHLRACPACREARVQWLAQEDTPAVLVPAGYFERLPQRVLRKLPARRPRHRAILWLAAAGLALALGVGGYLVGRVQQTPLVEASLPRTSPEAGELIPDMPFEEDADPLSQLSDLSPQDTEAVFQRLDAPPRP